MKFRLPSAVLRDERGNVALITALCITPLLVAAGMALDFNNAARIRLALQDATDSAALAIARNASTISDGGLNAAAANYINASYNKGASFSVTAATIDRTTLTVTVQAAANVPTTFSALLGKTVLPVSASSTVKGQGFDYEIALALDNSGSMSQIAGSGNTKIIELKSATTALLDAMMTTATNGHVKIGIVPFASSVNVGVANQAAAWLDTGGLASTAAENFDLATVKRLNLFDSTKGGMTNVSWSGCVETRPIKVLGTTYDYDVKDTPSSTTTPDTLFVPWFAPDESDGDNTSKTVGTYDNNYLNDEGGACVGLSKNVTDNVKQARTCKYSGVTPTTSNGKGPNYGCDTKAVTPLTNSRSTLDAAVTAMKAGGSTNILEGMMWAWRVISPTAPFTEGAAYGTANLNKVIILMSDGQNNYPGANNVNSSTYFSYGYSAKGRIGSTSSNTNTLISKLDDRTKLACDNAKAAGITVYTVALGVGADTALLAYCASQPGYAYAPVNGSDLTSTFEAIAASINKLRIAQ